MSMALFNEIAQLRARMDAELGKAKDQSAEIAALREQIAEYAEERRAHRKELRELKEQFATFDALREAIRKDAREILGQVRDRIDPTKVKMPHPLKALGYGAPR